MKKIFHFVDKVFCIKYNTRIIIFREDAKMIDALKDFGNMVFNDEEMKARIGADRYSEFRQCIAGDLPLPLELADVIASAMKDWALEKAPRISRTGSSR